MFKKIIASACVVIASLFVGTQVYATDVSVRISQPKTSTNLNTFDISVVALDIQNRPITIKCMKKFQSDAGFSQFGPDISLIAGGNSAFCNVTNSIINIEGTYQFQAVAIAGSDTVTSDTISVTYQISGPDKPQSYSKEKIDSCTYKIKFKSADDGGRTAKIEIYRSENTAFNTDSGNRVGSVSIGSNTEGEFTNGVPDCTKNYYYAIRAFDSIGNGSGVVGDSQTVTVSTTTTTGSSGTSGVVGAIPVSQKLGGTVLGETTQSSTKSANGNVLGQEATPTPELVTMPSPNSLGLFVKSVFTNVFVIAGILLLIVGAFLYARKQK